jgi:hypothetical protein
MSFLDTTKEKVKKASDYQIYKDLKYQELQNSKNKFDNRLYVSLRYRTKGYVEPIDSEVMKTNYNKESLYRGFVKYNFKNLFTIV